MFAANPFFIIALFLFIFEDFFFNFTAQAGIEGEASFPLSKEPHGRLDPRTLRPSSKLKADT